MQYGKRALTNSRVSNWSGGLIKPNVLNVIATGGTITYINGYAYHLFNSSSTFTVKAITGDFANVDALLIGGGGGGGTDGGGGGGGGGYWITGTQITVGTYTVTVGAGGASGAAGNTPTQGGLSSFGDASTADTSTAIFIGVNGGSRGGWYNGNVPDATARIGSIGGGGGSGGATYTPVDLTPTGGVAFAHNGGQGVTLGSSFGIGGGGGAGAVGSNNVTTTGGNGGAGKTLASTIFSSVTPDTYCAGGGGGSWFTQTAQGTGANGAGLGQSSGHAATAGTTNRGCGGGGGYYGTSGAIGATGGSGQVVVRYRL